jgi:hypothetical protein
VFILSSKRFIDDLRFFLGSVHKTKKFKSTGHSPVLGEGRVPTPAACPVEFRFHAARQIEIILKGEKSRAEIDTPNFGAPPKKNFFFLPFGHLGDQNTEKNVAGSKYF